MKKYSLNELIWETFSEAPKPLFKVSEAKKKPKKKEAVIDLTGDGKKKGRSKKEGKEKSQKKAKEGSSQVTKRTYKKRVRLPYKS